MSDVRTPVAYSDWESIQLHYDAAPVTDDSSGPCPAGGDHVWTDDAGEYTARFGVNVYCDHCGKRQ